MEIANNAAAPSSSSNPLLLRLQKILKSIESGDIIQSKESVLELDELLDSASASVATSSSADDEEMHSYALEMLLHILDYIRSLSVKEEAIDELSFVLPKAVCKFCGASKEFSALAESIVDQLVSSCNPRDMLAILCEALDSTSEMISVSLYLNPLLAGISKVLHSIKRRQFEHIKEAIPVILRALEQATLGLNDEIENLESLFGRAISIADSIRAAIDQTLEGELMEKMRVLLCVYILQVMTYLSVSIGDKAPKSLQLVSRLSCLFHYCQLSYSDSIIGSVVDSLAGLIGDNEDLQCFFPNVQMGASLSVIWGYISSDIAQSAKEDFGALENELRHDQTKRWRAIGMLKHVFSSADLPWGLKKYAVDFLCCITEGDISRWSDGEHSDIICFLPSLFATLQGIQTVMMYAPDSLLRRKAYDALKRVLADIPASQSFNILKSLVTHSNSPSMIAILLDCVREGMRRAANERHEGSLVWSNVLELVELVLGPSHGGPPALPEEIDAVSSALNLYRFVLIAESSGNTNYYGVLSDTNLRKAYKEWLLPLKTLVIGFLAMNKEEPDHLTDDMVLALYHVEFVLCRCIELVEEKLKSL